MSDRGRGGFGAQNAKIADDFSRRRVMLVDCLDAAGARFEDTAARARALESATGVVEPLAPVCHEAGRLDGRARIAIESALERLRPGIVIVASAAVGGGSVARFTSNHAETHWWPTGIGGAAGGWPGHRGAPPLISFTGTDGTEEASFMGAEGRHPEGASALDWAVEDASIPARTRLSLWDGLYLLAPVPLAGGAGTELLRAFADLDAHWNRVDLVVLGPADAAVQHAARRLGVAARVHFAGTATADAERTWLAAAAGVVFGNPGPVAGDLVVRTLRCGAPILTFGPLGGAVHGWLADRGAIPTSWASSMLPPRAKLEHLLEHDRAVERAIDRGRIVAESHEPVAVAERLGAALGIEPERRAA